MLRKISTPLFLASLTMVLLLAAIGPQRVWAENPQQRQADMALVKQYMEIMDRADTAEYKKIEDMNLIRGFMELADMADAASQPPPAPSQQEKKLNELKNKVSPKEQNLHAAAEQILFVVEDEQSQRSEQQNRSKGLPVREPSYAQKKYRETIKPKLVKEFGEKFDKAIGIAGRNADSLIDLYDAYLDGTQWKFIDAGTKVKKVFDEAPEIKELLETFGVDTGNIPALVMKVINGEPLGNGSLSPGKRKILQDAFDQLTEARKQPIKLSALPVPPSAPNAAPSSDSANVSPGIFRAGPQPWGHPPHNAQPILGAKPKILDDPSMALALEVPNKVEPESPKRQPTLGAYVQAAAELHSIDDKEFVENLINAEIEMLHQAAEASRQAREQEMIMVNQWVMRQETVWNEIQPQLIASGIPPARQWAILTKVVLAKPGYYGPRIFIESLNPTLVVNQLPPAPAPAAEVAVGGGDAINTQATNAVLEAAVANQAAYTETQVRPYQVSATVAAAPAVVHHSEASVVAAPTVVHHGGAEVAAAPVVRAAPSVSVVTRRPRPVARSVARATVTTAAVAAETVVPRRRVVRRRPVVEAGATIAAAPVVTVARARPVVRVRPVVRRPVVRARRVVRRGLR